MKNIIKLSLLFNLFTVINSNAQNLKAITGFHHIESVVKYGRFIYVADIGKELNPNSKDGDVKIIKLDKNGQVLDSTFVKEKLNAPKGLAIDNGILFLNDIDRLFAIDLKTGTKIYEIDFSKDSSFLNDIAIWDSTTLYVTATDKNKLFKVNLIDKSYSEIKIDHTISGINGLFCHKKTNRLYINGFGTDNKPNGVVGYLNLKDNTFTKLTELEGYYDGLYITNDVLYVSNWIAFEKRGILFSIQLYDNRLNILKLPEFIAGPADFIIDNDQLIVLGMMNGELNFIKLDTSLKQSL
jgi:hypothetical protein